MAKKTFAVGDRIRLTGKFLRSTGQYVGSAPRQVWTVTGFDGSFIITDEKTQEDIQYWTAEELTADPSLLFRRIHPGNVEKVR